MWRRPMKYNPLEHLPAYSPCSRCSSRMSNNQSRIAGCRVCQANFAVAMYLWQERTEEQRKKHQQLHKLWWAVQHASRWIGEPDTTAILQMVEAAADRAPDTDESVRGE